MPCRSLARPYGLSQCESVRRSRAGVSTPINQSINQPINIIHECAHEKTVLLLPAGENVGCLEWHAESSQFNPKMEENHLDAAIKDASFIFGQSNARSSSNTRRLSLDLLAAHAFFD